MGVWICHINKIGTCEDSWPRGVLYIVLSYTHTLEHCLMGMHTSYLRYRLVASPGQMDMHSRLPNPLPTLR